LLQSTLYASQLLMFSILRPYIMQSTMMIILPYNKCIHTSGAIWLLKPALAVGASTDPVDTSAQAALAPHQTTDLLIQRSW
jgi:hypothetical protein